MDDSGLRERVAKLLHYLSYGDEDDAPSWSLMSEQARGDLLDDADRILALVDAEYRPLLVQAERAEAECARLREALEKLPRELALRTVMCDGTMYEKYVVDAALLDAALAAGGEK